MISTTNHGLTPKEVLTKDHTSQVLRAVSSYVPQNVALNGREDKVPAATVNVGRPRPTTDPGKLSRKAKKKQRKVDELRI